MFGSIRDKIFTVQQDISASFKNLTIGDGSNKNLLDKQACKPNAGAELLLKYQSQWQELHGIAEENAHQAEEVDQIIGNLQQSCEKQWDSTGRLIRHLFLLPSLNQSLISLMEQIGKLENQFVEIEVALLGLENLIEIQEFQEKQIDHRFQLALYKEKKLSDLEQLKVRMAKEHAQKVQAYEERHKIVLQERQDAFKEAFDEEIQHYKLYGFPERIPTIMQYIPLEDVHLVDSNPAALDEFLAEEATEDVIRQYALAEAIADEDTPRDTDSDS